MKTVYKYRVNVSDTVVVEMPKGARLLHLEPVDAGVLNDTIDMWVEVESEAEVEDRVFYIVGTGHPLPTAPAHHVGTVQGRPFVWHVYAPTQTI